MTTTIESIKEFYASTDLAAKGFNLAAIFNGLDVDDDVSELMYWAESKNVSSKSFYRAYQTWQKIETLGEDFKTAQQLLSLYIKKNKIKATYDCLLSRICYEGVVWDEFNIISMERDIRNLVARLDLSQSRYSNQRISDAVSSWLQDVRRKCKEAAHGAIICSPVPDAEAEWLRLVNSIVNTKEVPAVYVIAVLKAFIWQVKRKLVTLPITDHLMPVLTGQQGCGKSTFLRDYFLSPVRELVYNTNFDEGVDAKNTDLQNAPIVFFDEMEKAQNTEIEAIKNMVTREKYTVRRLYSHESVTTANRTTYIAATNGALGEQICDSTGMRRFAAIPFLPAPKTTNQGKPVVDWATMAEIDYGLLWRSVDHEGPHPVRSNRAAAAELESRMEEERTQDSVEMWLRDFEVDPHDAQRAWATNDLYRAYTTFCAESGNSALAIGRLGKRMRHYTGEAWFPFDPPKSVNGKTKWVLKASSSAGNVSKFPDKLTSESVARMLTKR